MQVPFSSELGTLHDNGLICLDNLSLISIGGWSNTVNSTKIFKSVKSIPLLHFIAASHTFTVFSPPSRISPPFNRTNFTIEIKLILLFMIITIID